MRRSRGNRGFKVHGMYRRSMLAPMEDEEGWKSEYGKRAVIESGNFMHKQLTGDRLEEKLEVSRNNRALLKAFSFNIGNSIRLGCSWRLTV